MTEADLGPSPASCLFCEIIAGTVPAQIIASTDGVVAFRDIAPQAPTHVLVVPRRHVADATQIAPSDGDLLAQMVQLANAVASAEALSDRGYRLVFNVGDDAGNSVAHLHLHLIGGRRLGWPPG